MIPGVFFFSISFVRSCLFSWVNCSGGTLGNFLNGGVVSICALAEAVTRSSINGKIFLNTFYFKNTLINLVNSSFIDFNIFDLK